MLNRQLNLKSMVQDVFLGNADGICRLCFGGTAEGRLWLAERVQLELMPYCGGPLTLADLLVALTHCPLQEDSGLPECLCLTCANSAVDAYVFLQFMRHSANKWRSLQEAVSAAHERASTEPAGQALYIFMGAEISVVWDASHDATCTTNTQVVKRARSLHLKERKKKSKERAAGSCCQCEECGRTFVSARRLERHRAAHARRLPCPACRKPFRSFSALNMHVTRMHGSREFACPDCPKMFASPVLVRAHRKEMHTYAACVHCGRTYNKHSLRKHEANHGLSLPCHKCQRLFKSKDNLRVHQLRCVEGRRSKVECSVCGNTYSCKGTLSQHYRYAHGDNPLQCTVCGKKYMDKNKLAWHAAEHTGTKSFQCLLCSAYFKQANTLVYHMRAKHTGERPYACDVCGERFITSFRRTEHARRRHGAPGPACGVCGAAFVTRARLTKHVARHHPPATADAATTATITTDPLDTSRCHAEVACEK